MHRVKYILSTPKTKLKLIKKKVICKCLLTVPTKLETLHLQNMYTLVYRNTPYMIFKPCCTLYINTPYMIFKPCCTLYMIFKLCCILYMNTLYMTFKLCCTLYMNTLYMIFKLCSILYMNTLYTTFKPCCTLYMTFKPCCTHEFNKSSSTDFSEGRQCCPLDHSFLAILK